MQSYTQSYTTSYKQQVTIKEGNTLVTMISSNIPKLNNYNKLNSYNTIIDKENKKNICKYNRGLCKAVYS